MTAGTSGEVVNPLLQVLFHLWLPLRLAARF
jgi:hypothetical protein